ncbi:MAG: phosphoribosylaminoimidazolesuccinocarboxamide synthase [Gammaproteobacteria bacterium]|nr:phosphoribosylaminoimidazolesuccinocarboxamide synthase [Gammaproteobacteria bacterium]
MAALQESCLRSLPLVHRGKVRDSYAVDDDLLLIVATDRLSAFDVVLPTPVPGKGQILTAISNFWFHKTAHLVPNHLTGIAVEDIVTDQDERAQVAGRAVVVKRLRPIPAEAVVRGYLIGSGWHDYQQNGEVCGIPLPPGLQMAQQLETPLFTPATKAAAGHHDQNISYAEFAQLVGPDIARQCADFTSELYTFAAGFAAARGIIIADTKFEFGLDEHGQVILMDEILTPDSSRFWPQSTYREGSSPPSYDKQFVRDYLDTLDWDKQAPGPAIPADILRKTAARYREAQELLTGPAREPGAPSVKTS